MVTPNYSLSGKLAEDTNTFNGVVVKYSEPAEAKIPKKNWRLYPFKGVEALPHITLKNQSAYLLGRDRRVADLPIDHPSCSKQHAVIQFRQVTYKRDDDSTGKRVRPYLIDLESANGTFINNKPIEPRRYYELFEKDVIKFGFSSREYVLLHEDSKEDTQEVEKESS
ncbi:smad nuclear interacting protein 1-like [Tetranychus urticae]|uniref:smad nuclear interacting protein 1-like n=1 Tax=Tetranychus urticae TaxID=32264 RepID=UPI00077B9485|nr:smad nuclear interacting protein 1-like [Tetranychus urticae]